MKKIKLKSKKDYKKIKLALKILLFFIITFETFNYLNKNIYNYACREYVNLFTEISFNTKSNINNIIYKIFDIYDNLTNKGDFNYE